MAEEVKIDQEISQPLQEEQITSKSNKVKVIVGVVLSAILISAIVTSAIIFKPKQIAVDKVNFVQTPVNVDVSGTYTMNVKGDDWGPGVNKAMLSLSRELDYVTAQTFHVSETKTMWGQQMTLDRAVTNAFLCDKNGNPTLGPSAYVTIELYISPSEGNPFCYEGVNVWCSVYYLNFNIATGQIVTSLGEIVTSLTITKQWTKRTSSTDNWTKWKATFDLDTYSVAAYSPQVPSSKLFVWLHGAGEGGTDVDITLMGNKVTALAGEKFQQAMGGINVLVPQCPTMWPQGGERYLHSLVALIDDYVLRQGIRTVVIGGCSAGGYMTMNIARNYGAKYKAYVPICEAMWSSDISDFQLLTLRESPMYFIWSKDDPTVDPRMCENPIIERLEAVGAVDLHYSTTEHVIDTSGRFKDAWGNPYQYNGHWSWIYFFNDDTSCDKCTIDAFTWLANVIRQP